MTDLPLDLKYRPKKFSEIVGNDSVVKLLWTRSKQKTLSGRSMMFGGPKGCGKTSLARITARAIMCDDVVDGEPCGECDACRSVSDDSSVSFDEFDAATQGTVDRVRTLVEDLDYGSLDGKPRVIVLDEAHRLSKPSQDALLKAMEDRRLVVILCTTEPRKIVEAIRSRVEEYPVVPPAEDVLIAHLSRVCTAEQIPFESDALKIASRAHGACPRECICALDTLRTWGGVTSDNARQLFRYDRMKLVVEVLHLIDSDIARAFDVLDQLSAEGATWVRDTMVAAIAGAVRQNVGARSAFPVPVGFFAHRGAGWAKLANILGAVDKPAMVDIEAALIMTAPALPASMGASPPVMTSLSPMASTPVVSVPVAHTVQSVPTPIPSPLPPTAPAPLPPPPTSVPTPNVNRSIELDGVRFSPDESLTSLDKKVGCGSGPPSPPEAPSVKVEFDQRHVPLPEKEFANGLIRRIKGS